MILAIGVNPSSLATVIDAQEARAFEELGRAREAIEAYEDHLDLWKYADKEIPERRDAITRLAALEQGS